LSQTIAAAMVAMSNTLDITGHTTNHLQDTRDRFSRIIPFCPIAKAMYPLDQLLPPVNIFHPIVLLSFGLETLFCLQMLFDLEADP
jgi:hypothetical protein